MDPILSTLPRPLLAFIEGQLSNDETSTDAELQEHFIANGLTEEQAQQALTYRAQYLSNIYLDGFTPITAADDVLRFDPYSRQFKPA